MEAARHLLLAHRHTTAQYLVLRLIVFRPTVFFRSVMICIDISLSIIAYVNTVVISNPALYQSSELMPINASFVLYSLIT